MNRLIFYRHATDWLGPLIRLYLWQRKRRGKEDPVRFGERLGRAGLPRPAGKLVWIHGASVGEATAALPLIDRLRAGDPPPTVLLTTGTVTSARLMAARLPDGVLHQFVPVDRRVYVRRFLDHWRPDLALWMESEFWPNLLLESRVRGTALVLVNGRVSPASFDRLRARPDFSRPLMAAFDLCLAQDELAAERLRGLGARRVAAPGNLKFAAPPLPDLPEARARLEAQIGARPRIMAASTFEGEETLLGAVHRRLAATHTGLLTIIAPRHPERGPAIAAALRNAGLRVAQRSRAEPPDAATDIYLADTLGELGLFFRLAPICFVGKSLVPLGGQNPLEPARLGCAIVHGPHMFNFAAIIRDMVTEKVSLPVEDADGLTRTLDRLLATPLEARQHGERAQHYARAKARVLDDTLAALAPYLERIGHAGT